ncbi:MAG: hypothetical protein ACJ79S_00130 [Gemmatimonadaceae bacterium]
MTAHLSPLEAYRRDLLRAPDRATLGADDAAWIELAHTAWRMAGRGGGRATLPARLAEDAGDATPSGGRTGRGTLDAAIDATRDGAYGPLVDVVCDQALRMEESGALLLAATTLSALRGSLAGGGGEPVLVGRVLAQWARVERLLGDFDVARDLYDETARLGRRHALPELVVRADLGLAVLARIRGNYPVARARFRRALKRAEGAGLGELTGLAHQGLLIAAAVAGDFDTALTHGWAAFAQAAGDPRLEAYVLVNLATLCLDAREDAAALRGFVAAAGRTRDVSTWLAATAGAAAAAARLGRRDDVVAYAERVERALAAQATPYERAAHLLTLADAFADAGLAEAAEAYRARGLAVARAHAFAELELRYAEARAVAAPAEIVSAAVAPAALGPGARRVVRAMQALAGRDDPAAAGHFVGDEGERRVP